MTSDFQSDKYINLSHEYWEDLLDWNEIYRNLLYCWVKWLKIMLPFESKTEISRLFLPISRPTKNYYNLLPLSHHTYVPFGIGQFNLYSSMYFQIIFTSIVYFHHLDCCHARYTIKEKACGQSLSETVI